MNLKTADKLLLLTWKKLLLIPGVWLLCVILHNVIYGVFRDFFEPGGNEPFFFLLAVVVIPAYTLVCFVYSAVRVGWNFASRTIRTTCTVSVQQMYCRFAQPCSLW